MATYLDRILAAHRDAAALDDRAAAELVDAALAAPRPRSFAAALTRAEGFAVIAEVKRRSPSRGWLDEDLDPELVALQYRNGGAACLSVLTDGEFFGGSAEDLARAREASGLPVLRKDFTVCPADVCEARLMGADAVLLIVAALGQPELVELVALAQRLDLAALVEVHEEAEVARALEAGAELVGVNQRDLVTFEVDRQRAARLRPLLPPEVLTVAESGIRSAGDAAELAEAGYDAILVGEALIAATDRAGAVAALRDARPGSVSAGAGPGPGSARGAPRCS